jgi:crotonobetainyl-CoA:carnitine CoA-transferase CaiB-like acyl-CoA transferase
VDFKHPDGLALIRRLIAASDVLVENFRPGVLARMGLGEEQLLAAHPRLVYVSVTGFGHHGDPAYVRRPGYDPILQNMSGLTALSGPVDGAPYKSGASIADIVAGIYAAYGTLLALYARERTGRGQHVDVAMYDAMIAMADMVPFMWSLGEPPSAATAGRTGLVAGFAARDGHFVVAVLRDHQFERLAELVGHPEWLRDPRFATREGWAAHREAVVRPALEAWAKVLSKHEAAARLCELGIPAGPSNEAPDLVADPHVRNRDMLIEVARADAERPMLVSGNPVKLSEVSEGPVREAPRLGEHTDAVLRAVLGLGDDELSQLAREGAIARPPPT